MIVGVLAAVAGMLLAARVNGVTPGSQGNMLELDAVTAVVIGGTSLSGGRGSVVGTVLGALVFATLANGMNLLRIDSNWQLDLHRLDPARRRAHRRRLERQALVIRSRSLVVLGSMALGAVPACTRHDGPQVAFLLSTLQEERYQKDVKYFEKRARASSGMRTVTLAADNDNAKQIAQVEDVLAQGAKVLVIQPTDSPGRVDATSGSRTSTARRSSRTTARSSSPDLDYYVSHDSYQRRRAAGEGRARGDRRQGQLRAAVGPGRPLGRDARSRAATRTRSRRTSRAATSRS